MQMRVYINPRSGLSTYQQEVLAHRHLLNGHTCILEVAAALGPHEAAPYIMWLVDTFVINVHEFTKVGDIQFLKLWNMDVHTAQLLHVRCGFDVNTHMTSNLVNTYAGSRLRNKPYPTFVESAKILIWCGAKKTADADPSYSYLFQRRSRCARACRALVSRQFSPVTTTPGLNLPRDLREMLARALWESRVDDVWDEQQK